MKEVVRPSSQPVHVIVVFHKTAHCSFYQIKQLKQKAKLPSCFLTEVRTENCHSCEGVDVFCLTFCGIATWIGNLTRVDKSGEKIYSWPQKQFWEKGFRKWCLPCPLLKTKCALIQCGGPRSRWQMRTLIKPTPCSGARAYLAGEVCYTRRTDSYGPPFSFWLEFSFCYIYVNVTEKIERKKTHRIFEPRAPLAKGIISVMVLLLSSLPSLSLWAEAMWIWGRRDAPLNKKIWFLLFHTILRLFIFFEKKIAAIFFHPQKTLTFCCLFAFLDVLGHSHTGPTKNFQEKSPFLSHGCFAVFGILFSTWSKSLALTVCDLSVHLLDGILQAPITSRSHLKFFLGRQALLFIQ